jgi:hypothetical protein
MGQMNIYTIFFEKPKGNLTLGVAKRTGKVREISSRKWEGFIWMRMGSTGWLGACEHGIGHSDSMIGDEYDA